MSLINPDDLRIASVECTQCGEKWMWPTPDEQFEFSRRHIHGNPILQAWFDKRVAAREAESQ